MNIHRVSLLAPIDDVYSAVDIVNGRMYKPIRFTWQNDSIKTPPLPGRAGLLLESEGEYFIIGYFDMSQYEKDENILLIDGEYIIKAGESRAIIVSPTGTIGIYSIKRKSDGTLIRIPKFEYNVEGDDVTFEFGRLAAAMYGAASGGNILMEKDEQGNFKYKFAGKTSESDGSPRFSVVVENTASGPIITYEMDTMPTRINPVPGAALKNPINKLKLIMGSQSATGNVMELEINKVFKFTVDMYGKVVLTNTAAGLGSITMQPNGAIQINSGIGITMTGPGAELMATLGRFIQLFINHIHGTGSGPSTPPTPATSVKAVQEKVKVLTGIKGGA